ncbi:MAG: decaprenylphospho-beta-D-erythro-pentofuranosid-2-ulose 2-reductase [Acidimicrobiia bacterium]|nr:decaprenylphospho-beta-D-erythro-pentofuranosid-2-ulose 2-reductase [Acidimicrobiia bacterium]
MQDALGKVDSLLVLGGASDIARATALAFVERGARVVVLAALESDKAAAEENAAALRAAGAATAEVVGFDAWADPDEHQRFVDGVFGHYGDFDVVHLAWGVLGDQDRNSRDARAALAELRTNLTGAVSLLMPIANRLEQQGHGTAVVMSSAAAERPRRSNFVYGASKVGLDYVAQGLQDRLQGTGARVLIVRPGFVKTKMTAGMAAAPLAVDAGDVARIIVEGVATGKEIVWAPPLFRWVMSGLRHMPRAVFRRLPI